MGVLNAVLFPFGRASHLDPTRADHDDQDCMGKLPEARGREPAASMTQGIR
jgi:hypothetical protein